MVDWNASAVGADIAEDSIDLYEITDNRLKFKDGKFGEITARFLVTEDVGGTSLRLHYRRPGKGVIGKNIVTARLIEVDKSDGSSKALSGISSEGHPTDSDEFRSIQKISQCNR